MTICTPKCQKWTIFSSAGICLLLGILMLTLWGLLVDTIKNSELSLANNKTKEFKLWEVTPIPMYIEFYLYNWTNYEKFQSDQRWHEKPHFEQLGPYTYLEKHYRRDIHFNDNGTVTYKNQRIWHFVPEKSNGSLSDQITCLNVIAATVGDIVKKMHPVVRIGVNFFLLEKRVNLTVTKTAQEWLWDGYDDPMIDLLHKLNMSQFNIPFDKFGWFYQRNASIDYDGTYTIYDGSANLRNLGRIIAWNYASQTTNYPTPCGLVSGTSGELWYPVQDDQVVSVFSPDTCSTISLKRAPDDLELFGVKGNHYVGTDEVFDNGTKYPHMKCFSYGTSLPSGVRNVSACKFGAPAFVSYPHFYLADPSYTEAISGMHPNKAEHSFSIGIEPITGIPLQVQAAIQVNIHLQQMDHIDLFKFVKTTMIPVLWFKQTAYLTEELANEAKMLLVLPAVGEYTGYVLISVGCVIFAVGIYILWKYRSKGTEEEQLLGTE